MAEDISTEIYGPWSAFVRCFMFIVDAFGVDFQTCYSIT